MLIFDMTNAQMSQFVWSTLQGLWVLLTFACVSLRNYMNQGSFRGTSDEERNEDPFSHALFALVCYPGTEHINFFLSWLIPLFWSYTVTAQTWIGSSTVRYRFHFVLPTCLAIFGSSCISWRFRQFFAVWTMLYLHSIPILLWAFSRNKFRETQKCELRSSVVNKKFLNAKL